MRQLRSARRRRLFAPLVLSLLAFACAASSAASAGAGANPDPKIAPALAALAAETALDATLRVIVQGSDARHAAAAHGVVTKDLGLVGGVAARVNRAELERLAHDKNVSFVALDAPVALTGGGISTSALATLYPGRDAVSNAWSAGAIGTGVGVAVIDSGVTPTLDFGSRLVQVALDGQTGSLDDTVGHGTMVAGIAAGNSGNGKFIGIAPGANVYAININRPTGVYTSDVITALKWVFDNAHAYNIRVVNLSLTETVTSSYRDSPLDLAVERVWASGVFVAVAAGNLGAGQIDYAPANDPLVFTTGAFDTMDTATAGDDTALSWSSSGTTVDNFQKPDLVAPGRHIAAPLPAGTSLDLLAPLANHIAPGYVTANGTSFAAPQVAGAAAVIFQTHPGWSPDNVKWALVSQKPGAKPSGSRYNSLSLASSYNYAGGPNRANQGVPALVCAPDTTCVAGSTIASSWDSSSWTSNSWNSNSWNLASWNSNSWNSIADWTSNSWNSNSWNSNSWNTGSWASFGLWN